MDFERLIEPSLFAIVASAVAVGGNEWRKRAKSGTGRIEAEDTAQIGMLQALRAENESLQLRVRGQQEVIDQLRDQVAQANTRMTVMQMLSSGDPNLVVQVAQDSAFVDLHRPLRARPAPPMPARAAETHDPFLRLERQEQEARERAKPPSQRRRPPEK